jgi:hypothetical protein
MKHFPKTENPSPITVTATVRSLYIAQAPKIIDMYSRIFGNWFILIQNTYHTTVSLPPFKHTTAQ